MVQRARRAEGLLERRNANMATRKKSKRSYRFRKMMEGTKQNSGPTIVFEGGSYAAAGIEKVLQSSIDAANATATATAAFHQAIVTERAANAKGDGVYQTLRAILIAQYKSQPAALAEYGIQLVNKQVPDASKVATAVRKRAATRAPRHPMGNRQKEALEGTVPQTAPVATPTASDPRVKQSQSGSAPTGAAAAASPHAP